MSDLIERLQGHVETLRGVASGVYSSDIQEAIDEIEQLTNRLKDMGERADTAERGLRAIYAIPANQADYGRYVADVRGTASEFLNPRDNDEDDETTKGNDSE